MDSGVAEVKAALLVLLLAGCANGRYLTDEEDAELRKNCEPAGCVSVPVPVFNQILQILRANPPNPPVDG